MLEILNKVWFYRICLFRKGLRFSRDVHQKKTVCANEATADFSLFLEQTHGARSQAAGAALTGCSRAGCLSPLCSQLCFLMQFTAGLREAGRNQIFIKSYLTHYLVFQLRILGPSSDFDLERIVTPGNTILWDSNKSRQSQVTEFHQGGV